MNKTNYKEFTNNTIIKDANLKDLLNLDKEDSINTIPSMYFIDKIDCDNDNKTLVSARFEATNKKYNYYIDLSKLSIYYKLKLDYEKRDKQFKTIDEYNKFFTEEVNNIDLDTLQYRYNYESESDFFDGRICPYDKNNKKISSSKLSLNQIKEIINVIRIQSLELLDTSDPGMKAFKDSQDITITLEINKSIEVYEKAIELICDYAKKNDISFYKLNKYEYINNIIKLIQYIDDRSNFEDLNKIFIEIPKIIDIELIKFNKNYENYNKKLHSTNTNQIKSTSVFNLLITYIYPVQIYISKLKNTHSKTDDYIKQLENITNKYKDTTQENILEMKDILNFSLYKNIICMLNISFYMLQIISQNINICDLIYNIYINKIYFIDDKINIDNYIIKIIEGSPFSSNIIVEIILKYGINFKYIEKCKKLTKIDKKNILLKYKIAQNLIINENVKENDISIINTFINTLPIFPNLEKLDLNIWLNNLRQEGCSMNGSFIGIIIECILTIKLNPAIYNISKYNNILKIIDIILSFNIIGITTELIKKFIIILILSKDKMSDPTKYINDIPKIYDLCNKPIYDYDIRNELSQNTILVNKIFNKIDLNNKNIIESVSKLDRDDIFINILNNKGTIDLVSSAIDKFDKPKIDINRAINMYYPVKNNIISNASKIRRENDFKNIIKEYENKIIVALTNLIQSKEHIIALFAYKIRVIHELFNITPEKNIFKESIKNIADKLNIKDTTKINKYQDTEWSCVNKLYTDVENNIKKLDVSQFKNLKGNSPDILVCIKICDFITKNIYYIKKNNGNFFNNFFIIDCFFKEIQKIINIPKFQSSNQFYDNIKRTIINEIDNIIQFNLDKLIDCKNIEFELKTLKNMKEIEQKKSNEIMVIINSQAKKLKQDYSVIERKQKTLHDTIKRKLLDSTFQSIINYFKSSITNISSDIFIFCSNISRQISNDLKLPLKKLTDPIKYMSNKVYETGHEVVRSVKKSKLLKQINLVNSNLINYQSNELIKTLPTLSYISYIYNYFPTSDQKKMEKIIKKLITACELKYNLNEISKNASSILKYNPKYKNLKDLADKIKENIDEVEIYINKLQYKLLNCDKLKYINKNSIYKLKWTPNSKHNKNMKIYIAQNIKDIKILLDLFEESKQTFNVYDLVKYMVPNPKYYPEISNITIKKYGSINLISNLKKCNNSNIIDIYYNIKNNLNKLNTVKDYILSILEMSQYYLNNIEISKKKYNLEEQNFIIKFANSIDETFAINFATFKNKNILPTFFENNIFLKFKDNFINEKYNLIKDYKSDTPYFYYIFQNEYLSDDKTFFLNLLNEYNIIRKSLVEEIEFNYGLLSFYMVFELSDVINFDKEKNKLKKKNTKSGNEDNKYLLPNQNTKSSNLPLISNSLKNKIHENNLLYVNIYNQDHYKNKYTSNIKEIFNKILESKNNIINNKMNLYSTTINLINMDYNTINFLFNYVEPMLFDNFILQHLKIKEFMYDKINNFGLYYDKYIDWYNIVKKTPLTPSITSIFATSSLESNYKTFYDNFNI